ncbi:MAG: hypothetical protein QNJ19_01875 [Woeseiaceae bacterium]|nr:hypothetical protein [Woeseiaceae bacterium]
MKFLHTTGSFGLVGGMVSFMILLNAAPDIGSPEYASLRAGLDLLSSWLILPSMALVLLSGIVAMAIHFPFQNAGWVWLKAVTGILFFEATLASFDAPAARAAVATQMALAGEISQTELVARINDRWGAWWVLLTLAGMNVVLAIWRPRFVRPNRKRVEDQESSVS